ncbi:MAG: DNA alkylation repair protein [Dermatophilaceae bacterium]
MPEPPAPPPAPPADEPPAPHAALIDAIHRALSAHADPTRAVGQQRYMKSTLPYLGLTTPVLRSTMRALVRDPAYALTSRPAWEATIRALWDGATHREHWYAALVLARHPRSRAWRDLDALPLYRYLITKGAWWDVVDETATHLVRDLLDEHPSPTLDATLREWAHDDNRWIRRSAIICQVGRGPRTDTSLLTDAITPSIADRDFFARKAIGWALRDYARTNPDWVRAFVDRRPDLSGLSRREALKHLGPLDA